MIEEEEREKYMTKGDENPHLTKRYALKMYTNNPPFYPLSGELQHNSLISISDLQSQQRMPCCSHLTWSSEEFNKWVRQNKDILPHERILQRTHFILFGYLTNERLGEKDRWVDGNLYVRDNTGIMPCELLHFKPDWLGHLLLFPSWVFIPQRGKGTAGYVEILEDPVPVIPGPEKTINIIPVFYPGPAAQLLSARSQSKRLAKLNLAGELLRLSNILHIHHKTFFFLFLKCFRSAACVSVLVQEAHHLVWHHALQLGHKYTLTDLKISCLKASEMKVFVTNSSSQLLPYCMEQVKEQFLDSATEGNPVVSVPSMSNAQPNRILEVKEAQKMLVPHRTSKMMSYIGTITHVLNAQAGLFELDNKFTLCLAYQQLLNSGRGLRPGACIELRDVHLVQKAVDTSSSVLGACLRSMVVLKSFSAYNILHHPITYHRNLYIRLLLHYNLSLPFYLWLVSLLEMFKQRNQERNMHLEILAEPHHCPIEQDQIQEPPCQIPSFSLLYPMVEKQGWGNFSSSPQLSSASEIHSLSAQELNHRLAWSYCSLSAENFQPRMVLLGVLECSRRGYLQLQDKHKAVPCVIFHRDGRPFAETSLIGCLLQVEIFQLILEQFLQSNFTPRQQLETPKLYVQFFFEDAKILHMSEKRIIKNLRLPEKRNAETLRACESSSSGVKGNDTSTAEHRYSEDLDVGRAKPEASMSEHFENSAGKYSSVSRLFLVTQKEGLAQRNYLPSSESKGEDKQVCFQATVLWMSKPELCTSLGENGGHKISALEKTNEGQQSVLLLFQRKSLRWFPFLHPNHMYQLIIPECSDLDVFGKPSCSLALGSHLNSLNCSLFLPVPDGALLNHVSQISQLVSPVMEQKLFSIVEILSPRFTGSLVSFSGEVVEKHLCEFRAGKKSRTNTQHKANPLSLDCTVKLTISPAPASSVWLDVYIEAPFLPYLWGVLPGAKVLFSGLQRKISRHLGSTSVLSGVYLYNVALQPPSLCQIKVICHLTCVLFMSLRWTCSVCSSAFIEGRCSQNHPPCLSHTGVSKASANLIAKAHKQDMKNKTKYCFTAKPAFVFRILVEDGTSEFVVLCKDQQVQKVLSLSPKEWDVIQHHVQSKGSVYVQPNSASSGPRSTEEPEDMVTWYLRSLCRSPVVCRTIQLTFQLDRKFSKVQETGLGQLRRFCLNELEFLSHTRTESNLICLNIQEAT
ncbi:hypothetical protein JD844_009972 [Phrynosoma platyrhinos]|uniref:CST complex subunit CTC1 n=1 Tax=Phrynosoma platyrhinos TaxID=52577 RepID=A0ABQ7TG29_PHRPL|nr:hypothetical protein JD844_009972 [Phrynosoma platyrhinos]